MKKCKYIFAVLFFLLASFMIITTGSAGAAGQKSIRTGNQILKTKLPIRAENHLFAFALPESLQVIEDSAFEGTAFSSIHLPEHVESIGDYAFAHIDTLKDISIPNATQYIGKNAFSGSNHVTINASATGYARDWAKKNGIPFNPITCFCALNTSQTADTPNVKSRGQKLFLHNEISDENHHIQTGRMTGELNRDRYETITAFHIQGRSPPMC